MTDIPTPTTALDEILQRLVNAPPWNVHQIVNDEASPWFQVDSSIVNDLVIREYDLATQIEAVPAQVQFWGRMLALCERVHALREREYREWRDRTSLDIWGGVLAPDDVPEGVLKKLSEKKVDQIIRTRPEYREYYARTEAAKEALESTKHVFNGFRAKQSLMESSSVRYVVDSANTSNFS